jgi:hypothetical protein
MVLYFGPNFFRFLSLCNLHLRILTADVLQAVADTDTTAVDVPPPEEVARVLEFLRGFSVSGIGIGRKMPLCGVTLDFAVIPARHVSVDIVRPALVFRMNAPDGLSTTSTTAAATAAAAAAAVAAAAVVVSPPDSPGAATFSANGLDAFSSLAKAAAIDSPVAEILARKERKRQSAQRRNEGAKTTSVSFPDLDVAAAAATTSAATAPHEVLSPIRDVHAPPASLPLIWETVPVPDTPLMPATLPPHVQHSLSLSSECSLSDTHRVPADELFCLS